MQLFQLTQETFDAAQEGWPGDGAHAQGGPRRKDRPRSIQVFRNRFMEKVFGTAHPITPILWFGPPMVYGWYRGLTGPRTGFVSTALLFALGWLMWSLLEYVLHRFVFHWKPSREEDKLKAFLLHGYHHVYHEDKMRLVAPPVMSWGPGLAIAGLCYLAFGTNLWAPVFAGVSAGYVAYDWIHYYTHHFRPRGGVGKWLRRYHMIHHFKEHDACFGVSSPLWDLVFGTYRPLKSSSVADEGRVA